MRYLLIFAVSILFTACQTDSKPSKNSSGKAKSSLTELAPKNIMTSKLDAYSCKDSLRAISYTPNDSLLLFLPDTALAMPPKESADGQRFSAHSYMFWIKGKQALLQKPTGSLMKCDRRPKQKPWASARLRGVDFRAQGQEPGWIVEITNDKQLTYIGNYGQDTLTVSAQHVQEIADAQPMQYHAKTNEHKITVSIRSSQCTDTMNRTKFPYKVSITVDENKYEGCGKYLTN